MALGKKQLEVLNEWSKAAQKAAEFQALERQLRKELVERIFGEDAGKGTHNKELNNGFKLKAVIKENTRVDEAALASLGFTKAELKDTIKYKPEFRVTGYKALPEDKQKLLDQALIVRPGMPELTIVPPKEKR